MSPAMETLHLSPEATFLSLLNNELWVVTTGCLLSQWLRPLKLWLSSPATATLLLPVAVRLQEPRPQEILFSQVLTLSKLQNLNLCPFQKLKKG